MTLIHKESNEANGLYRRILISVSKKTNDFQLVAIKKLREQGLFQLKTKEFSYSH